MHRRFFLAIVFFQVCFHGFAQDSVSYFDFSTNAWEDAIFIDRDPILISSDSFQYKIQGHSFTIHLTMSVDTMWYQNNLRGIFPVFIDTIYQQNSLDKPEPNEVSFEINESRFDTIRDPSDPSVVVNIDTVAPPIKVRSYPDFYFAIDAKAQIASAFKWTASLAEAQPGLSYSIFQIDTYSKPIFVKGPIAELPKTLETIWESRDKSVRLSIYTLPPTEREYPNLQFLVYLKKE